MKKNNLHSLWQLISVNYKEFLREPGMLFWSLAFPVLMAWVLGIAFTKRAESVQTIAVVSSPASVTRLDQFLGEMEKLTSSNHTVFRKTFDNKLGKLTFRLMPVTADSAILMLKRGETSL